MKIVTCFLIVCAVFSPEVFSLTSEPIVKDYLTPTTGKWLYPHNHNTNSTEASGTPTAPNAEILQALLTGFSRQVDANIPSDIDLCLDNSSAMTINQFSYSIMNKLANSDFMTIPTRVEGFRQTIDPEFLQCLQENQQFHDLLVKYGIENMSLSNFYYMLSNYTLDDHRQNLVDQASKIRSFYEAQDYENAGSLSGQLLQAITESQRQPFSALKLALIHASPFAYFAKTFNAEKRTAHSVLHPSAKFEDFLDTDSNFRNNEDQDRKRDLIDFFRGVFEQAGLNEKKASSFLSHCVDESEAKLILDSIAQSLAQILGRDVYNVPETITKLKHNLSPKTMKCLESRHELRGLIKAYGLEGKDIEHLFNRIDMHAQKNGYNALEDFANKVKKEIRNSGMKAAGEYFGKALKVMIKQ